MIGPGDRVLYVGKSIRLRSRLLSYFRTKRPKKAAEIVGHTHHIEWQYVPSEFAALLAEMRDIQLHRPPYNVEHKRDRAFCFIKLTREEAPRLLVVAEVRDDGALYFGPFRGRERVRDTVREIADLLELRDCAAGTPIRFTDQLDLFGTPDLTPLCLRADVGRCLAPCAARCSRTEYEAQVQIAEVFLNGDGDAPLAILRERMRDAAVRLQFEYAGTLRDSIKRLTLARDELLSARGAIDSLSFVYCVPGFDGDDRIYVIRRGSIRAELPAPCNEVEASAVRRQAMAILDRHERWSTTRHAAHVAEVLLVARWFRLRPEEQSRTSRTGLVDCSDTHNDGGASSDGTYRSISRTSTAGSASSSSAIVGRRLNRAAPAPPGLR
jgi:excinuclease ABC subunit C